MDRQVLLRKIMRIGDEVRRLEQDLIALLSVDIVDYPDNYSNLAMKAAVNTEYITRKIRELVFSTTNIEWVHLLASASNELGIVVNYDKYGIVEITIPCLIPGRKKKPTDFITAPLYAALERFISERPAGQPFEKFTRCVICITHVYDKRFAGKGRERDFDNIETKPIIDVINSFLLTDDNGVLCSIYNTSEFSECDCTRISIMESDMFFKWISDIKNG